MGTVRLQQHSLLCTVHGPPDGASYDARMPGKPRSAEPRPLHGVRVLDASRILAGPTLAQTLGDLGAEVIKVEDPRGGDPTRSWGPPFVGGSERVSAYFVAANRNKRSIALDLKSDRDRETFLALVAASDVLVDNFLPRRWREFGLSDVALRRANPKLIRVAVTGYGSRGRRANHPAFDLVLQGESGLMSVTGFPTGEPVRVGVAIIDILTALQGAIATVAALFERQRTGRGRRIDVSMIDAGTALLSYAAQSWLADGRQPPALGSRHPNLTPYQAFPARDGWILIGVGSDAMFDRFCARSDGDAGSPTDASATTPPGSRIVTNSNWT